MITILGVVKTVRGAAPAVAKIAYEEIPAPPLYEPERKTEAADAYGPTGQPAEGDPNPSVHCMQDIGRTTTNGMLLHLELPGETQRTLC
jgi:hypothetical protein